MSELVAEYVEAIVVDWYCSVSRWLPPGDLSTRGCAACQGSPLPAVLNLVDWPHDVTHSLVHELTIAANDVSQLLDDAGHSVPTDVASSWLRAALWEHQADIEDILMQCVEPRLAEFLRNQAEHASSEFELLHPSNGE